MKKTTLSIVMVLSMALWLGVSSKAFAYSTNPEIIVFINQAFDELAEGKCSLAESHLKEAYKIDPNDPYVLLNLGVVYQNSGRKEEAKEMYSKAMEMGASETPPRVQYKNDSELTISSIAQRNINAMNSPDFTLAGGTCPIPSNTRTMAVQQ